MKLDPKTAERMKRAAIDAQAKKRAEASKSPSKRDPGYSKGQRRKLAKIGLSGKVSQPESVLNALDQVPDAQTGRIVGVRQQDATAKGERSTRAAMMQQVHPDFQRMTNQRAMGGWLAYSELWDRAQPNLAMEYGERTGGKTAQRDENKDPAWLQACTDLREFHNKLGRRYTRHASQFMERKANVDHIGDFGIGFYTGLGLKLAEAFEK